MKKGFTIIELIVTIVIIAIVGGIGVVAYNNIFDASSKNYYKTVEQSLLLSGSEYFEKNRDELPIKGYNVVTLDNLEDGNYVSPVKDKKGGTCESGEVYVTRNSNTRQYEYEVCLKCLDYESEGAFCKGYVPGSINVNAYLEKDNNHKYNPLLSYKNVEVTKDNVILELYLDDSNLSYYSIDKVNNHCIATDKKCSVKIENSGSYLVSAYSANGVKIADDRIINVKIDKEAPTFDIINDKRYVITDGTNKKDITIKLDNVKDDMGIKKVSYCIKLENETCEENEFKNLTDNTYLISENLASGSYHIEVKVEDVAQNVTTKSSSFDVSYYVILEYEDGETNNFEVIKGKEYGYLDLLPGFYNNKGIHWQNEETNEEVFNDSIVELDSTHTLVTSLKVNVPTNAYCEDITYNGTSQKLTKTEPDGVIFTNNYGTNAATYTIIAQLLDGYSWSDESVDNKTFECVIKKEKNPISVITPQKWETVFSTTSQSKEITGVSGESETVSYEIISQPMEKYFSIQGTTITMKANTPSSTYNIVIRATAAESANYNAGYKDINLTIVVKKANNPISVVTPQKWETIFSTTSQSKEIIGASGEFGVVSYEIISQPDGEYFIMDGTTVAMKANTPINTYNLVIRATSAGNVNYNTGYKDINLNVLVSNKVDAAEGSCNENLVYNGKNQTLVSGGSHVSYTNNTKINAGEYQIQVQTDSGYLFSDGTSSKTLTCSIKKATPVFSVTEYSKNFAYGNTQTFGAYAFTIGGNVTVTSSNANVVSTWTDTSKIEVTNDWTTHHNELVVYVSGKRVGTANVVVKFTPSDQINYNPVSITVPCTIIKATPIFAITESNKSFDYGTNSTFGAYSHTTPGKVSVSSNNTDIVTASLSSSTINVTNGTNHHNEVVVTLTGKKKAGSAVVTVNFTPNDTTNYNSVSVTSNITVNKVAATLTCKNKTFTGSTLKGCTCTGGTCKNCKKTAVKTYTASCTPDENHTAPPNKKWKIKCRSVPNRRGCVSCSSCGGCTDVTQSTGCYAHVGHTGICDCTCGTTSVCS